MTVSTETKSKFQFKFKTAKIQIEAKFKASSPTAGISGNNSNCQAYPPTPPPPPTEEPCAPSYKSGQQITPNPDRNCKEGNPNSSLGANKISKYNQAGAKANADDDDKLDGEQKDRAFDGERSRRTKRSSDASAVANVDAGSGSR